MPRKRDWTGGILEAMPILLLGVVFLVFGALSPSFLEIKNISNILVQSSATMILATGMAFVLLSGNIDLSVGSIMYLGAALAGKLIYTSSGSAGMIFLGLLIFILCGVVFGCVNGILVTRLRILAFIVTLGTLYVGRGLGHLVTQTRAMNLPESFLEIGASSVLFLPVPIIVAAAVVIVAQGLLDRTVFGRQIYALGHNPKSAHVAGIPIQKRLFLVFVISGVFAALAGIVALSQVGAVDPTFGFEREFTAITAAVLGGVSLFGGKGRIFPGVVMGAILLQTIQSGLVVLNVDPYYYPILNGAILFLAVLVDALKNMQKGARHG